MKNIINPIVIFLALVSPLFFTKKVFARECWQFEYQEKAQRYYDRNFPESKKMDRDNDGIACEHLPRLKDHFLTREKWNNLVHLNRNRKRETNNKSSLRYIEVLSILEFMPEKKSRQGRVVWQDPFDNQRIEIKFYKGRIKQMKGVGF